MPAGLQIFNDSGTIQIDENWKNFGFRQTVDVGISITLPTLNPYVIYDLVVPGQNAMVAHRSSTFAGMIMSSNFDGTNYRFKFLFIPPNATGTHSETVRFWVFDVPPSSGFSSVGLEVFNGSGERVFHSDMSVMKISGVQACDTGFTGASGREYVPLIAVPSFYKPGGTGPLYAWFPKASGNTITPFTSITPYTAPFSGAGSAGLYAAVDVTGLS
jgi:hypothetical protein